MVLSNVKTLKNRKVFHVLLYSFLCSFCELKKPITLQRFRITQDLSCAMRCQKRFKIWDFLQGQSYRHHSNPCLSNKGGNNEQKLQNYRLTGTYQFLFYQPLSCVSSGFGGSIGTISPWESKLAMFQ